MKNLRYRRPNCRPLPAATVGTLAAALLVTVGQPAAPLRAQTTSTWNGGTDNWSNASLWTPAAVPNSANADVFLDGGKTGTASTVNVDGGYTVGRLTVDAGDTLSVNNSQVFTVTAAAGFANSGSLVANGTVTLVSFNGFQTGLVFNGATSLGGGGTVNLQEASRIRGSGTLTNTSTIQGSGAVGNNELSLVNRGVIDASGGGTITLDPAPGTGTFVNQGLLRGTLNSVLQLTGNGGGTFAVLGACSQLNVAAGALTNLSGTTLTGGTYQVSNTATTGAAASLSLGGAGIVTNNATVILQGANVSFPEINALANNQGALRLAAGANFTTAGALTNSGQVEVAGATLTVSGTLTNAGTILTTTSPFSSSQPGQRTVQGAVNHAGTLLVVGSTFAATGTFTGSAASVVGGNGGTINAPTLALDGTLRPGDLVDDNGGISGAAGFLTLGGQVNLSGTSVLNFDLGTLAASDRLQVNGRLTLDGILNVAAVPGFGLGRYDLIDLHRRVDQQRPGPRHAARRLQLRPGPRHGRLGEPRRLRRARAIHLRAGPRRPRPAPAQPPVGPGPEKNLSVLPAPSRMTGRERTRR